MTRNTNKGIDVFIYVVLITTILIIIVSTLINQQHLITKCHEYYPETTRNQIFYHNDNGVVEPGYIYCCKITYNHMHLREESCRIVRQ